MKITFIDEIEARKAWSNKMCCPKCDEYKYNIHHQLKPEEKDGWWVECPNCGWEGPHSPDREIAIIRWKQRIC